MGCRSKRILGTKTWGSSCDLEVARQERTVLMRRWIGRIRVALVVFAASGLLLPPMSQASVPGEGGRSTAPARVLDFALQPDGSLHGQVVDRAGQGVSESTIAVLQGGEVISTSETDPDGRYALDGLSGGVFHVLTEQGVTVCRLWPAGAAPPSAQAEALLVHDDPVIRGRLGHGGLVRLLSNPWVLGGIVAAAIAVPLALDRDDAS